MSKTKQLTVRDQRYNLADAFVKAYHKCQKLREKRAEITEELIAVTAELQEMTATCTRINLDLRQTIHSPSARETDVKCIVVSDAEVLVVPNSLPAILLEVI